MNKTALLDLVHALKGIKAGDRLPAERELAAMNTAGREVTRERLTVLDAIGLITIKHGKPTVANYDYKEMLAKVKLLISWQDTKKGWDKIHPTAQVEREFVVNQANGI